MKKSRMSHITAVEYTALNNTVQSACFFAIRARVASAGTDFLFDLMDSVRLDNIADRFQAVCNEHTQAERERVKTLEAIAENEETIKAHKKHTKTIKKALKQALVRTAEELELLYDEYELHNEKIVDLQAQNKKLQEKASQLYKQMQELELAFDSTYSNRQDLINDGWECLTKLVNNDEYIIDDIMVYQATNGKIELADDECQVYADNGTNCTTLNYFNIITNWIARKIHELVSVDSNNSTVTKPLRKLTAEELEQYFNDNIITYTEKDGTTRQAMPDSTGKIPVPVKRARISDCYDTIEIRDYKRGKFAPKPNEDNTGKGFGYYLIRHYKTQNTIRYFEDFEDGTNEVEYIKCQSNIQHSYRDNQALALLKSACNFTDREILFLEKVEKRLLVEGDIKKVLDWAYNQIGISQANNRRIFKYRLSQKVLKVFPNLKALEEYMVNNIK